MPARRRLSPRSRIGYHAPIGRAALMRIGTRGSALALAQAGHVAERLTIEAGDEDDGRARHDHDQRATARARRHRPETRRPTSRAGSTRSRPRCSPARSTSRCTPRRTCRASWPRAGAAGRARAGGRRGRAVRRATLWSRSPRARAWGRAACAEPRSCGPRARTCGWSRSAATSTRACGGSTRGWTWTRSCSRMPGCCDWIARRRSARCSTPRASCPPPGRACSHSRDAPATLAVEAAVRAIGDADAFACLRAERARRARAGRELPHAARRPRACPPAAAA